MALKFSFGTRDANTCTTHELVNYPILRTGIF